MCVCERERERVRGPAGCVDAGAVPQRDVPYWGAVTAGTPSRQTRAQSFTSRGLFICEYDSVVCLVQLAGATRHSYIIHELYVTCGM